MYLEIEMFNRLFNIDTIKLTFFYFPLMYFCLLVFVPYIFIYKYWRTRLIGVLAGILMFCSDLSFIPGLLGIFPQDYPWTAFFTPTIWAIFTLNGNLPALFIMFLCIFYLKKYYEDSNFSYLIMFALLGFSAFEFKSTMGPHIMGAGFLTGIVSIVFMKDRKKGMLLCTASVLAVLVMAMDIIVFRGGTGNYIFRIDLLNLFYSSLKKMGFSDILWFFAIVIFPFYILITFGTRVLIFYFLKDVFKKNYFDVVIIFLIIFIVSGFFIAETMFLGDPSMTFNNFIWFAVQSLMGAWFLLSLLLTRLKAFRKKHYVFLVIFFLLSVPSTVQFIKLRFDNNYYTVGPNAVEIVKYLEKTPPKSVVLHPPNLDGPSFSSNLTGRPSVINFLQSYVIQLIGQKEANNRLEDVKLFFNTHEVIDRSFILKKYKVDYVYAPSLYAYSLDKESMLLQVVKNNEYVLYDAFQVLR